MSAITDRKKPSLAFWATVVVVVGRMGFPLKYWAAPMDRLEVAAAVVSVSRAARILCTDPVVMSRILERGKSSQLVHRPVG